ncbi:hypothetical protein J5868_03265 [Candidatus Saccharibacteria bacterium]|nr:hypothetical protein [Candidatus Saccharibacteria bacterium]
MPNPEFVNQVELDSNKELSRDISKERGSMTLDVAKRDALMKERELLLAKRAKIEEEIAILRRLSAIQSEENKYNNPNSKLEESPQTDESEDVEEDVDENVDENNSPEAPRRAKIEYVKKKAKNNSSFRSVIIGVTTIALAGLIGVGIATDGFNNRIGQVGQEERPSITETAETEKGIKDGYDKPGLWLSKNKDHDYDYGDAKEVSEVCDHDEVEMLKYTADNQVESLADYMAEFPKDLCPEGFYGLKPRAIEKKLEALSPDEYEEVKAQAMHALDEALTRTTITKYDYHHYGMLLKDKNGAVVHENMQLVDRGIGPGVEVVEFYWVDKDGMETGSMLVNIRRTSANEKGEVNGHIGGLEVLRRGKKTPTPETPTPTPETPTPTPETPTPTPETPTPTPTPLATKDPSQETEHAGPRVNPTGLDESVTPPTKQEEDQANFDDMERQRQEDEARRQEAERIRREQEEAERQAAAEAEARRAAEEAARKEAEEKAAAEEAERQRKAEEAARQAAEQAAREQAAAEEAERQRQAEEAARQEAQRRADEEAAANAAESAGNAGASASERAGMDY